MVFHKIGLLILAIQVTSITTAQERTENTQQKADIGLFLKVPGGFPSLEYRLPVGIKYKLNIGLDYEIQSTFPSFGDKVLFASDSVVMRESVFVQELSPTIRIGIDRQLPVKYFSIGAALQLKYFNRQVDVWPYETLLNSNGDWAVADFGINNMGNIGSSTITYHFLMPAFRGNLTAQFPLGESFLLSVYYASVVGSRFFVKETNKVDPDNSFVEESGYSINADSFIGVGVRYVLRGKN
jgi:hypothetical protein